jgi:pimeloyl-ACP methyl ester carboxylesterase
MLHWQRQGTGPEVVLVHGFLGSSKIFKPLTKHLARQFSVTTIDLPGSAGSYDVPVPSSVKELSLMVADTIRSAGIDKCSILGHSLGAWVALELSLQLPTMLEKIVLYGGSPDGYCPERFEPYENSIERIRTEGIKTFAANLAAEWFRLGKDDPLYPLALEAGIRSNEEAAIQHVMTWNQWVTRDRLHQVKTPTLIACGDSDRSTHPDLSIEMWNKISDSQLFIAPNSGHIVHLEHTDAFNSIVANFLK